MALIMTESKRKGEGEITPEAKSLGERVDSTFRAINERYANALTPDPGWKIFSSEETSRRVAEATQEARRRAESDLKSLEVSIDREDEGLLKKIETTLRPLQNSVLSSEREVGRYFEERAYRVADKLPLERLPEEFDNAMRRGQFDYASELLFWAELNVDKSDKNLEGLSQRSGILKLRKQLIEATGLGEAVNSRTHLSKKRKQVTDRVRIFNAGFNGDYSAAKSSADLAKMVEAIHQ